MSFAVAGSIASTASSQASKDVGRSVKQAIGKPLDGLAGAAQGQGANINWVNFNYPPVLRLIHYDLDELPSTLTGLVRCLKVSFQITTFTCFLNFLDTFIILISTEAPWRWLLQSLLHLVLLPASALAVFYAGYRGLAEPDPTLTWRYKVGQPALAFLYFLQFIVPWGSINGLVELSDKNKYTEGSVFWSVAIFAESFLWLINTGLSCLNLVRIHRFDIYGTNTLASGSGTRF